MEKDKILVVEDDLANAISALLALEELGLDGETAGNVVDAVKLIRTKNFVAVLTDMQMPMKSGEAINNKGGEFVVKECIEKNIPVMVVTGGYINHKKGIKILSPLFDSKMNSYVELQSIAGEKEKKVWIAAWNLLNKNLLKARRRYIKYNNK